MQLEEVCIVESAFRDDVSTIPGEDIARTICKERKYVQATISSWVVFGISRPTDVNIPTADLPFALLGRVLGKKEMGNSPDTRKCGRSPCCWTQTCQHSFSQRFTQQTLN